jgi:hypothetical protein
MFDSAQLPVGRSTLTVRYNGDENVAATTTTVEQRVRRAISRVSTEVLDETVVVRKTQAWVEVTVELPDFPRAKPEGSPDHRPVRRRPGPLRRRLQLGARPPGGVREGGHADADRPLLRHAQRGALEQRLRDRRRRR